MKMFTASCSTSSSGDPRNGNASGQSARASASSALLVDNGGWHLRVANGGAENSYSTEIATGPNQLGRLTGSPKLWMWDALQSLLDAAFPTAGSSSASASGGPALHFLKRCDVVESVELQAQVWARALRDHFSARPDLDHVDQHQVQQVLLTGVHDVFRAATGPATGPAGLEKQNTMQVDYARVQEYAAAFFNAVRRSGHGSRPLSSMVLLKFGVVPDFVAALHDPELTSLGAGNSNITKAETSEQEHEGTSGTKLYHIVVDLGFGSARVHTVLEEVVLVGSERRSRGTDIGYGLSLEAGHGTTSTSRYRLLASRSAFQLGGYCITSCLQDHLRTRHQAAETAGPLELSRFSFYRTELLKQRVARCHLPRRRTTTGAVLKENGEREEEDVDESSDEEEDDEDQELQFHPHRSTYDFSRDPETLFEIGRRHAELKLLKEWGCYQLGEMYFQPSNMLQDARQKILLGGAISAAHSYNTRSATSAPSGKTNLRGPAGQSRRSGHHLRETRDSDRREQEKRLRLPTLPELVEDAARQLVNSSRNGAAENVEIRLVLVGGGSRMMGLPQRLYLECGRGSLFSSFRVGDELSSIRGLREFAKKFPEQIPWVQEEDIFFGQQEMQAR